MEWLESLLPLVIFAIYFLSRLRKAAKNPRRQPAPQQPHLVTPPTEEGEPATDRPLTPFETLVQQIQQAAREAAGDTMGTTSESAPVAEPEFQPVGAFEHETHGFGPENPFSEEAFERMPRGRDITEHALGHLQYDAHKAAPEPLPMSASRRAAHPLVARLQQPSTVRDAVVLREILERPRSLRKR